MARRRPSGHPRRLTARRQRDEIGRRLDRWEGTRGPDVVPRVCAYLAHRANLEGPDFEVDLVQMGEELGLGVFDLAAATSTLSAAEWVRFDIPGDDSPLGVHILVPEAIGL